ncbi:MAG: hypothetical protein CME06_11865 [Gemmatimonadetes bacterium]|nr:hypothetical protein [Gemmatimonadota bacterium]
MIRACLRIAVGEGSRTPSCHVALLLMLIGFLIRFIGIGFGASMEGDWVGNWHDDEVAWVAGSISFADLNPHYWGYPALHLYLLYLLNLALYSVSWLVGFSMPREYGAFILASEVERLMIARAVSVAFATTTLWLVWKLANRSLGRTTALVALALAVFNPALVRHAHYATVDSSNTFFVLAALVAAFAVYRDPDSRKKVMLCGALAGCAASIKYLGGMVALALPIALACGLSQRGRRWLGVFARGDLWGAALISIAVFFAINIYILLDWNDFITLFSVNLEAVSGSAIFAQSWYAGLTFPALNFFWGFGGTVFIAIGVVSFIFGKRREGAILLAFPLVFAAVLGDFEWRMSRQVLPAIPILLIVAARGVTWLASACARPFPATSRRIVEPAGACLFTGSVLFTCMPILKTVTWTFTHSDTRYDFASWAASSFEPGTRVLLEDTGAYGSLIDDARIEVTPHHLAPSDAVKTYAELRRSDVEYVVTSSIFTELGDGLSREGGLPDEQAAGFYRALEADPLFVPIAIFDKGEFDSGALLGRSNFEYIILTRVSPSQFEVHNPTIKVYRRLPVRPTYHRDSDGHYPHHKGYAYLFDMPVRLACDDDEDRERSRVVLYEDDRPLGPPHAMHKDVMRIGGGRFSHWDDRLFFSTSDGSDPNTNGRTYRASEVGP